MSLCINFAPREQIMFISINWVLMLSRTEPINEVGERAHPSYNGHIRTIIVTGYLSKVAPVAPLWEKW